jgi:hypothetical protein
MGTRGLIHIKDNRKTIATIYRQYDCYPTGLGSDILEVLKDSRLVNGYSGNDKNPEVFNGMGCLGAYLISALKTGQDRQNSIGNVYLMAPNTKDVGEEYSYVISGNPDKTPEITLEVKSTYDNTTIYKGLLKDFKPDRSE